MKAGSSHYYRFGLLGYPLGHSLSPRIHQCFLDGLDLEGEYALFSIPPEEPEAISALVQKVKGGELDGLNVTIPYKQTVLDLVDDLTPEARAMGAVNTIFYHDGQAIGGNTDSLGFWMDLQYLLEGHPPAQGLVLGAGGSARAVIYALQNAGWETWVAARRPAQAEDLAALFPSITRLFGLSSASLAQLTTEPGLIVNTTPVGMVPIDGACPWPEEIPLPARAAIYDLVYNPRITRLIRRARSQGLRARGGIGMLVAQAALAFQCWTGREAPQVNPDYLGITGL